MSDIPGQNLGRYHMVEPLGRGGMATVYKAFDTRLERQVAVKVIRREAVSDEMSETLLRRFEREAKSLAQMSHLHIVNIFDYGEHQSSPYLVMEYLPGGTLKGQTGKPCAFQEAARLLSPVGRALEYAHQRNVIHRDVKPANILLTEDGQPKLSDFGIAKILEMKDATQLTRTGVGVGTPEYMAPEQWTGKPVPQTDIYALGVVFYELVTGRKPYEADTPAAVLLKQTIEPLPRPRDFVPHLPELVENILYKALAKQPEDRYPGMGQFATALEALVSLEAGAETEVATRVRS
jgi:eukaryotic-like serine/threonine-protein kinase